MHVQENSLLTFDLGVKVTLMVSQYPQHHVTYSVTSLKLLRLTVLEEIHLQENTLFDIDLGVKLTQNVAQYPLHHVMNAATNFEVATSNG